MYFEFIMSTTLLAVAGIILILTLYIKGNRDDQQ